MHKARLKVERGNGRTETFDADGVLAVPLDQAAAICDAAEAKHAQEAQTLADIAAGTLDTRWVDAALKQRGFLPD